MMQNTHDHEHQQDETNSEPENQEDEQMSEEELMKSIDKVAKRNKEQRQFWDDQLKQMNRWINL